MRTKASIRSTTPAADKQLFVGYKTSLRQVASGMLVPVVTPSPPVIFNKHTYLIALLVNSLFANKVFSAHVPAFQVFLVVEHNNTPTLHLNSRQRLPAQRQCPGQAPHNFFQGVVPRIRRTKQTLSLLISRNRRFVYQLGCLHKNLYRGQGRVGLI